MLAALRAARLWLRTHPEVVDGALAALLAVAALADLLASTSSPASRPLNIALVVAGCAVVTVRRRAPVTALIITSVVTAAGDQLGYNGSMAGAAGVAFLVALYSVAAYRGLAVSAATGGLAIVGTEVSALVAGRDGIEIQVFFLALEGAIWWIGRAMRVRRAHVAELRQRALRLEQARDAHARAARAEERARIARELHDVVAHHVSVMTVQAAAARRVLARDPQQAQEALTAIEQTGRTALAEMRRIVGVLRSERETGQDSGVELAPQPGLDQLPVLSRKLAEAGLQVKTSVEGTVQELPSGVGLAAFRVVQEALTNTLKHAGPAASAHVRIRYDERELVVIIEDDGRGWSAISGLGEERPGHGLVGMRERVALYGGRLWVGPRVGGGFAVRARFPLAS